MRFAFVFGIVLVLLLAGETGYEKIYQRSYSFVVNNLIKLEEKDPFLLSYGGIYMLPRYITGDTSYVELRELLRDNVLWRHLEVASYDVLPDSVRNTVFRKQFSSYGYLLDTLFWKKTSVPDWDKAPVPVRSAAYLLMIKKWARLKDLNGYTGSPDATAWFTAMMMQESFLNHSAVNDGGKFRDIGLPQLSKETRRRLVKSKEFVQLAGLPDNLDPDSGAAEKIFFNPYYSIAAGVMEFRDRLKEADGDLNTAIMAYNVGISAAKRRTQRGLKYLDYVKSRYDKYIKGNYSTSWNYVDEAAHGYYAAITDLKKAP